MADSTKPVRSAPRRLAAARLAAVQALYLSEMNDASADSLIHDFLEHGVGGRALIGPDEEGGAEEEVVLADPDATMFAALVRGTLDRRAQLDTMIEGALEEGWTVQRLEAVMRSILRVGAYELSARADIPPKVSISEYVGVASAFYGGTEPGLVNAVLDRIARVVRAGELGSRGGA